MHPGSQQDQRLSAALVPGYFRPDELSLAQRLRQALQLARQLRFVDAQGADAGDWGQMLEADLSLLLAELAALPLSQWEAQAEQFAWLTPSRALASCLALARRVDRWHVLLEADTPAEEQPLRDVLRRPLSRALDESLGLQLQAALIASDAPAEAWRGWHPIWGLGSDRPAAPPGSPAACVKTSPRRINCAACGCSGSRCAGCWV
jgi:hypothetical protein